MSGLGISTLLARVLTREQQEQDQEQDHWRNRQYWPSLPFHIQVERLQHGISWLPPAHSFRKPLELFPIRASKFLEALTLLAVLRYRSIHFPDFGDLPLVVVIWNG